MWKKQRCEPNSSFHILKRISFPDFPRGGSKNKYHPSRIHGNGTVCLPTFKLNLLATENQWLEDEISFRDGLYIFSGYVC